MSVIRAILAFLCPPLAVADLGCGSVLIVFLLTCMGWIPGILAALIILNKARL
ncbi:MAG: YqaE/Pmp3 family membrane protein [Alistipes sp.]|nr:YqaE/Pmp3 family membrane protein [Alistipes sp.]